MPRVLLKVIEIIRSCCWLGGEGSVRLRKVKYGAMVC